eukprot:gnl/TRDRNA2_/TRDRNA2_170317_c0_seq1.p1 gnl/TRDRNA2_/TRDRNA2_170317_c0~~gnl/TRDRNA2_/TRDRNA2_170317_c0_seq1.p1  ORF type:complete len:439 (+),score=131.89 gnl/TRDRNA2_/TRDRNA2_170317_c0_seq1:202-1518(+)
MRGSVALAAKPSTSSSKKTHSTPLPPGKQQVNSDYVHHAMKQEEVKDEDIQEVEQQLEEVVACEEGEEAEEWEEEDDEWRQNEGEDPEGSEEDFKKRWDEEWEAETAEQVASKEELAEAVKEEEEEQLDAANGMFPYDEEACTVKCKAEEVQERPEQLRAVRPKLAKAVRFWPALGRRAVEVLKGAVARQTRKAAPIAVVKKEEDDQQQHPNEHEEPEAKEDEEEAEEAEEALSQLNEENEECREVEQEGMKREVVQDEVCSRNATAASSSTSCFAQRIKAVREKLRRRQEMEMSQVGQGLTSKSAYTETLSGSDTEPPSPVNSTPMHAGEPSERKRALLPKPKARVAQSSPPTVPAMPKSAALRMLSAALAAPSVRPRSRSPRRLPRPVPKARGSAAAAPTRPVPTAAPAASRMPSMPQLKRTPRPLPRSIPAALKK